MLFTLVDDPKRVSDPIGTLKNLNTSTAHTSQQAISVHGDLQVQLVFDFLYVVAAPPWQLLLLSDAASRVLQQLHLMYNDSFVIQRRKRR